MDLLLLVKAQQSIPGGVAGLKILVVVAVAEGPLGLPVWVKTAAITSPPVMAALAAAAVGRCRAIVVVARAVTTAAMTAAAVVTGREAAAAGQRE